jgi:hypothetical protein
MSFAGEMQKQSAEIAASRRDPWMPRLKRALQNFDTISTAATLDMLRADHTRRNAMRLAPLMRELGYVSIMSRRLHPGGFKDTVSRGWTRKIINYFHFVA